MIDEALVMLSTIIINILTDYRRLHHQPLALSAKSLSRLSSNDKSELSSESSLSESISSASKSLLLIHLTLSVFLKIITLLIGYLQYDA